MIRVTKTEHIVAQLEDEVLTVFDRKTNKIVSEVICLPEQFHEKVNRESEKHQRRLLEENFFIKQ